MKVEFRMPTMEVVSTSLDNREATIKISGLTTSMGETLGNSIRRTLLSCIPGIAPIAYTIMGACEEFTPIKGLTGTTTEIGLALKKIKVAACFNEEPVVNGAQIGIPNFIVLEISKTFKNESVTFGDFVSADTGVDVVILNPDEEITYVGEEKIVNIRLLLWTGVGYAKYDELSTAYGDVITNRLGEEAISIDSIFSPVERAIFDVEVDSPSKGLEILTLTVTTNGFIPALTAISQACSIISATSFMVQQCTNIIAQPFKFSVDAAKLNSTTDRPKDFNDKTAIDIFGLSTELYDTLKHKGINIIGDFNEHTDPDGSLRVRMNKEIMKVNPAVILPEYADKLFSAKIATVEDLIHINIDAEERQEAIKRLEDIGFKIIED